MPHNTVHQHFNSDPKEPLILLSATNRLYAHLGYDNVVHLEDAPQYSGNSANSANSGEARTAVAAAD